MRRYKKSYWEPVRCSAAPHPCAFGCGATMATKRNRQLAEAWMWFCGYGDEVIHFCPQCVRRHRHVIETLRSQLNVKPADYPHKKHNTAELFAAVKSCVEST